MKVGVPEEELLLARRRIERLVTDAGISDPTALDDANLASAVDLLAIRGARGLHGPLRRDPRAGHAAGRAEAPVPRGPHLVLS